MKAKAEKASIKYIIKNGTEERLRAGNSSVLKSAALECRFFQFLTPRQTTHREC